MFGFFRLFVTVRTIVGIFRLIITDRFNVDECAVFIFEGCLSGIFGRFFVGGE
jgi:hypothetical protein